MGRGAAEPAATSGRDALPRRIFPPLPARIHDLPGPGAERQLSARGRRSLRYRGHSRRRNRVRRAGRGRGGLVRGHHHGARPARRCRRCGGGRGARGSSQQSDDDIESLRDLAERRAGGARAQRSARARGRAARQRHPYRAVPHRACGADARRRPAARDAGAVGHSAAGVDLAGEDSGRPQHRRTAAAAGRRGAGARQPLRTRRPRRDHADAGRRKRRHPPVAARPRPARNGQARPVGRATKRS